jgi:hypothetical protein
MRTLAMLIVAVGAASAATVTTFTSQAAFLGAVATPDLFDFNQPNGPITNLGTLASITTVGGDASGQVIGNTLCGSSGGSVDCFPPVLFTFTVPNMAFGYDNLDFNGFEEAVVTINFTNGDAAQEFVFDLGGAPAFTPIFFGAVSDVAMSSVQIYSRDPGTTNVVQRANVIDNVILGANAVPEPATLGLYSLGAFLLMVGRLARKRSGM